jgi:hypothetical protein
MANGGFFMTLLTIEDVAQRLKCSDDQVRILIRNRESTKHCLQRGVWKYWPGG